MYRTWNTQLQVTRNVFFTLIDNCGTFIKCCAQYHSVTSLALRNYQDVVIYYAKGVRPIGRDPGLLYVVKDSFIMPVGRQRERPTFRSHEIEIEAS